MKMYGLAFTDLLTFFCFCFLLPGFRNSSTQDYRWRQKPPKQGKESYLKIHCCLLEKMTMVSWCFIKLYNSVKLPKTSDAKISFSKMLLSKSCWKDAGVGVIAQLGLILTTDVWIPRKPALEGGCRRINNSVLFSAT